MKHQEEVDRNIKAIMNNSSIQMDTLQSDHCTHGDAVHVWLDMLDTHVLQPYKEVIEKQCKQCITPLHLVVYQAHSKYKGAKLSMEQDKQANDWIQ